MSTPFFGRTSVHLDRTGFKPPHLFSKTHARGRVWLKTAALLPLIFVSAAAQGWPACQAISAAVCGALLAEAFCGLLFHKIPAYHDGETIFYGLFCSLILPLTLPLWVFFAASFISAAWGRELFGGFGQALFFPPSAGLLVLFLGLPSLVQAFDFKQARALAAVLSMEENPLLLAFYPASPALEDVSLAAIALGVLILLGSALVRWEWPIIFIALYAGMRLWLAQESALFLLSGGLWLALFWGFSQTSALPLTPAGRRAYAVLAALLAGLCPLRDEALRVLAGQACASFLAPWLEALLGPRPSSQQENS